MVSYTRIRGSTVGSKRARISEINGSTGNLIRIFVARRPLDRARASLLPRARYVHTHGAPFPPFPLLSALTVINREKRVSKNLFGEKNR